MSADPVEAGRKGGRSRSGKKLAACRRNGFQRRKIHPVTHTPVDDLKVIDTPETEPEMLLTKDEAKESGSPVKFSDLYEKVVETRGATPVLIALPRKAE